MERAHTTSGQALGIAGLVLGILTLLLAFIPCVGIIALIPGVLAIIFSVFGLAQAQKNNGAKGLNIGAIIVSTIGTLIAGIWVLFIAGLASIDEEKLETAIEVIIDETVQPCNPELEEKIDVLEQKLDSLEKDEIKIDTLKIEETQ